MDIYAVLDSRITIDQLKQILTAIGQFGYGKDASTGCGRFEVVDAEQFSTEPVPQEANSWLTLAPCAPQNWHDSQGHGWQAQNCFYDVHVRFGKHGAAAGGKSPNNFVPWKNPVLLADTGALLTPVNAQSSLFCGQGLSELSVCHPDTVQQGYSPILPIHFDGIREGCQ
ncbi:hypothetical protein GCM10011297_10410 [Bacterioplanes sanyensis]|nr:hypothetical protein GCM10011297_10410 [Bacterioplanes sanyensis]